MFAGDACKARVGPKPALFHHFCYENYCKTILNTPAADDEECNYCMDCRHPKTTDPIMVSGDLTAEEPTAGQRVEPVVPPPFDDPPANPAKRKRGAGGKK